MSLSSALKVFSVDLAIELEDLFQVGRIDIVFFPKADAFVAADIIRDELLATGGMKMD